MGASVQAKRSSEDQATAVNFSMFGEAAFKSLIVCE